MNKKIPEVTDKDFKKLVKELKYQRYFSRWPVVDNDVRNMDLADYYQIVWAEYAEILNNGNGINTIQSIKKLIQSELEDIQKNLDDFPKDANNVYEYRLKYNQNLLKQRSIVIDRVLTQFATHGKIKQVPNFEIDEVQKYALQITCSGKQHPHIKEVLQEYLKRKEADQSKTVQKIFEELEHEYDLKYSTFSGWVQEFNVEFKSIVNSKKAMD